VAELFNGAWTATLWQLSRLAAADGSDQDETSARTARRLVNSVVRPLAEALARMPSGGDPAAGTVAGPTFVDLVPADLAPLDHDGGDGDPLDERLWQLAVEATGLRLRSGLPAEIQEATAALQDIACRSAPDSTRIAELRAMQSGLAAGIQAQTNGPYLVTNVENIQNWLGERIETPPQVALCRCGSSATKPFCDGTHAKIDFVDRKDPKRVPDRRDSYEGVQITVLDNRGLCAHSGFCTDRVSSVLWAGGFPALLRMTRLFYAKYVPTDPLLAPLFANMSPDHPERVAAWLGEVFGGPNQYTERYGGYGRMVSQHIGKGLTEAHRTRWASLMVQAAN